MYILKYIHTKVHTYIQMSPKEKKSANSRFFFFRARRFRFFSRFFSLRSRAFFYSFALASAKARKKRGCPALYFRGGLCTSSCFPLDYRFLGTHYDHFQSRTTITANVWAALCNMLSILHCQTTVYHPEVNSAVKRLHRRLKDALRAHATMPTWIPWVLLGLCL
jgi:hypothetical protein